MLSGTTPLVMLTRGGLDLHRHSVFETNGGDGHTDFTALG
jgi:hypothetical protein